MSAERIDHGLDALRNLEGALELMQENGADGVTLASQQIAIAGVQATLALVEQERVSNLLALGQFRVAPGDLAHFRHIVAQPKDEFNLQVSPQITEALGLA